MRDLKALARLTGAKEGRGGEGNGEEAKSGFEVWSKGASTVGSRLEAKAWTCGIELRIEDVVVREVSCISFPFPPFSVV